MSRSVGLSISNSVTQFVDLLIDQTDRGPVIWLVNSTARTPSRPSVVCTSIRQTDRQTDGEPVSAQSEIGGLREKRSCNNRERVGAVRA